MEYLKKVNDYLETNAEFFLDGAFHRFGEKKECWAVGRKWNYQEKEYWQVTCGNFKKSEAQNKTFKSWDETKLSSGEKKSIAVKAKGLSKVIVNEEKLKQKEAQQTWEKVFNELPASSPLHSYCKSKKLETNCIARVANERKSQISLYPKTLCIPIYNSRGELAGVQRIYKRGKKFEKRFAKGTEIKGSLCALSNYKKAKVIYVCEGFATAVSIFEVMKLPTVICFQASNILDACLTIRKQNADCKLIICADRDLLSENIGEVKAQKAASVLTNCIVKVVRFPENSSETLSDFNDLAQMENGKQQLEQQLKIDVENFVEEEFKSDLENGFTYETKKGKRVRDYQRLLEFFRKKHSPKYVYEEKRMLVWTGTHYRPIKDQEIKTFAQKYFNYPPCENEKQRVEFLSLVKASEGVAADFFDYKNTKGLINLKNGVYDYENELFLAHDPKYPFRHTLPIKYNRNALCPTWDKLMQNLSLQRKHFQDAIEEFMGFAISDMEYDRFNKALILDGGGSNGKTTVIRAIKKLCGEKNCSAISMTAIPLNRFLISGMADKLVNFSEEEPKKVFSESGHFKKLTGGSPVYTEKKGKDGYSIESRTKLILSYNEAPYLSDSSLGMKRRLMIIPFDLNLEKHPEFIIENIQEKLESEMSGILLKAIKGLKRLLDNKKFTEIPESKSKIDRMIQESDTVRDWFEECVIYTGNKEDKVSSQRLYESYLYHLGTNFSKLKKPGLTKKIKKILEEQGLYYEHKKIKFKDTLGQHFQSSLKGFTHLKLNQLL